MFSFLPFQIIPSWCALLPNYIDSISNLIPGTYNVIVTVAGCPFLDSAIVNEPEQM